MLRFCTFLGLMETQLPCMVIRSRSESPPIPSGTAALCALPFFSVFFVLLCDWLVLERGVNSRSAGAARGLAKLCRAVRLSSSSWWLTVGLLFPFWCICCRCRRRRGAFLCTFTECVTLPAVAPWCPEGLSLWGQFLKTESKKTAPT